MKRIGLVLVCALVALMTGAPAAASGSALPKALIDEATVTGGSESQEAQAAEKAGLEVTVVSDETWKSMTQAEFGQYRLLISGDPTCGYLPPGLIESASTFGPVVLGDAGGRTEAGNRIVVGTDPVFHDGALETARGTIIREGIAYAAGHAGTTNMYFDTTCAAEYSGQSVETLEILEALSGGPPAWAIDSEPPCGGSVSLIASNPSFSELTTEDLEGWECSVHEAFPTFPAEWSALAVATDTESHPTCGVDPGTGEEACGEAYILVAGSGIVVKSEQIALTPTEATNLVGTDHTVTAYVTRENEKGEKEPVAGQEVTFTVTGVNGGASGTCEPAECKTDPSGNVSFTYHDSNGAGEDTIHASFVNEEGSREEATAAKTWVTEGPPSTTTTTSLSGGGQSGEKITVPEGTAVTDNATISGEDAATATGTVTYMVYTDSKCEGAGTEAGTVSVSEGEVPASESETLAPGTYYWQASYSGDENNGASASECGSETETVMASAGCTTVVGSAVALIREEEETERLKVSNDLSTNLAAKQKLVFKWEHGESSIVLSKLTSATCTVGAHSKKFVGTGEVMVNGEPGWTAKFRLVLNDHYKFRFRIRAKKGTEEPLAFAFAAGNVFSEEIA
jgi:hypothetical protein